jgi:hypothetical protein
VRYVSGEVFPPWRWFEKQDAIKVMEKKLGLKDKVPDFFNIVLERHRDDEAGFDVLFVDPIRKGNFGSRLSHRFVMGDHILRANAQNTNTHDVANELRANTHHVAHEHRANSTMSHTNTSLHVRPIRQGGPMIEEQRGLFALKLACIVEEKSKLSLQLVPISGFTGGGQCRTRVRT